MRELAPDGRPDLRHLLRWAEPVEARHQRGVQARGDRQGRGWNGGGSLLRVAFGLRFQYRLRHFLDEQRNAICALDNVLQHACRKGLIADDAFNHGGDFALPQPVDGESGHVRPSNPGRIEVWPEGNYQQHAKVPNAVHRSPQHFQARGSIQCTSSKIMSTGL